MNLEEEIFVFSNKLQIESWKNFVKEDKVEISTDIRGFDIG